VLGRLCSFDDGHDLVGDGVDERIDQVVGSGESGDGQVDDRARRFGLPGDGYAGDEVDAESFEYPWSESGLGGDA